MRKSRRRIESARVGIVTPAYNSSGTIKKTLNSILAQSYLDFEVFVVDDHSTDDTVKIVKEYCKKDGRIHLVQLKNGHGAAAARNLAIKHIEDDPTIKYVAFLDSDDYWLKGKLKSQVSFMEKQKVAFSYGDYDVCDMATNKIYKRRVCPNRMSYFRMLIGCSVGCLTVMYDKDVVGHIEIPNLPKRNDYALWCVILKKVRRGLKYPGVLAVYDQSPNGISSGKKTHLIKFHYRMHRDANHFGRLKSGFFTVANVINYVNNVVVREKRLKK